MFYVATGFGQSTRDVKPIDIVDIGLPALYNITGRSARIRQVTLVDVPPAVHLLGVTAHPGLATGIVFGNLATRCRTTYPSYPVTDAVARPHSQSNWYLVLAITFAKPGRYDLRSVKISYTTGGQDGWQYQNVFTIVEVNAARPGTKPAFGGCP